MRKLLLLPLVVLMFNCRNSKSVVTDSPKSEVNQPVAAAPSSPQPPIKAITVGTTEQIREGQQPAINQGITGKVIWQEGNNMPSPDAPRSSNKKGVQRTVYIYELTNGSQASATNSVFYSDIKTKLVTQVVTDANGNFAVSLKPGKYSLFTKEEEGLYANLMDGAGHIFPVEVQQAQVTNIEFLINYKASY